MYVHLYRIGGASLRGHIASADIHGHGAPAPPPPPLRAAAAPMGDFLKSVHFYRKVPKDLTEATLTGGTIRCFPRS